MKNKAGKLNEKLKKLTPEEGMRCLADEYPGKVAFSTSLGAEDQVITDMIAKNHIPVSIFTLDTGRMFQETYDLLQVSRSRYGLEIEVFFPERSGVEEMVNNHGINLFYDSIENRELCCEVRKVEPLSRALKGMQVWISGLRRNQSVSRSELSLVEWDDNFRILKIHPLFDWSDESVWNYIRGNKVPYNPLHDKGFPSIGCLPCTRAILPGEDVRAGRWWWENTGKKECGIHQGKKRKKEK
jgi:phosphoadenosine phosphosulfate reductase